MEITKVDNAVIFTSGMEIDSDGAPKSYHPNGGGLDDLSDAGSPGNWYGVVTDTGERTGTPIIQGDNDPAPGYYVSPTALRDHSKKLSDPTAYVDSSTVAYISIPPELEEQGVRMGDLCMVFHKDQMWPAIVGESGPRNKYGEGSICLAQRLGIPSSPINGGVDSGVTYCILTGTSKGWSDSVKATVENDAQDAFAAWGGLGKLKSLLGWQ